MLSCYGAKPETATDNKMSQLNQKIKLKGLLLDIPKNIVLSESIIDIICEKIREAQPLIKFKPILFLYNFMMSISRINFFLLLFILGSVKAQDSAT